MKTGSRGKNVMVIFLLTLIMFVGSDLLAQGRIWTLDDCINYAIENNLQVKQSELLIENNEVNILESKLTLLPSFNGSANYSYSWGRVLDRTSYEYTDRETKQGNFGLDASLTIFRGFQNINNVKKYNIDFLASKYAADKMKDDISLLLTQAYLSVLFNKELLRVAREQVLITNEQISRTSKLVEAGTLARGSLLEIQAQGAKEEINVITYENSLSLAYLDLLQILDLPATQDFDIEVPELDDDIVPEILPASAVYDYAVMNQPGIKSAELQVESSYKGIALAKGLWCPSLYFQTGWGTNYSNQYLNTDPGSPDFGKQIPLNTQLGDNQSRYMGFGLNIPIFNGYQASSNVKRARITAANAEYTYELTKNELRKSIEMAYNDAQAGYKSYLATQKSLKSFEESFRYTEQKFNVGLSNSVDYNLAKTQLTAAQSELLRAKYDLIFRSKILDFYMGKPLTLNN